MRMEKSNDDKGRDSEEKKREERSESNELPRVKSAVSYRNVLFIAELKWFVVVYCILVFIVAAARQINVNCINCDYFWVEDIICIIIKFERMFCRPYLFVLFNAMKVL